MKKLGFLFIIVLVALLPALLWGQNVIQVAAGDNVINPAIASAQPGDIIELTTSGGVYTQADSIAIDKNITIRAAAGLEEKPILKRTTAGRQLIHLFASLTLDGVVLDGAATDTDSLAYAFAVDEGVAFWYNLKVNDCEIKNFGSWGSNGRVIWPPATTQADTVVFTNCFIHHMGHDGVFLRSGSSSIPPGVCVNVTIENCTFWHIFGTSIDVRGFPSGHSDWNQAQPKVLINHVTIFDQNTSWKAIYPRPIDYAVVKNIIIAQPDTLGGAGIRLYGDHTVCTNVLYWNSDGIEFKSGNPDTSNIWNADPMFADPTHGDFNLMEGSPAIGKADDGGNLGDTRWKVVPNTAVAEEQPASSPRTFALYQNYPNPFNPSTTIGFDIAKPTHVRLAVYDVLGRLVETLLEKDLVAGHYSVNWQATKKTTSGILLYRLEIGDRVFTRKMILMK